MSSHDTPMFEHRVKAVLGPTNTGKTHLAITRMLAHSSGIIGFPLRLLARENYDRMVAAKGARFVALITGEEKILPPEARWFSCTVEAMPLDRKVEFVAVDEIQLCADPDRGHIFTDRLLHARGMVETMFLGAETIRPLLHRLVPRAEIDTRPRLSQLTYAGPAKLTRLPSRSAVVAFSAGEVYAIAEAIRRRRGGCAVVMGRLSPRTRNAQVALYQNREVDFLVATDAIGMGLNMDVDHVAFASLTKFDGHRARELNAQEAAQIAGRAGRGMRDGTFGVTADCPPLSDEIVGKIEGHQFEALQTLAWRNSALDFASPDDLLNSLSAPPPFAGLARGNDADDYVTLSALSRDPDIRRLSNSRSRVRLLWEACGIPDFRKLADETHQNLCARVFKHLAEDNRLPDDWISAGIRNCDNIEGDLDTLMSRLASIRVWSFIAARNDWFRDAAALQGEARAAEDKVSDALHERLTARFVDRRAAHLMRKLDENDEELMSSVTRRGEVMVEGHPVGKLTGFLFEPDTKAEASEDERKVVLRAARRALRDEVPRRVSQVEASGDDAFGLTPLQRVTWTMPGSPPPGSPGHEAAEIARLKAGPSPDKPLVEPLNSDLLDTAQRDRIRARLATWLESTIKASLAPLEAAEAKAAEDSALRGHLFRLREYLGLLPGGTEREIPADLRAKLKAVGVRAGRFALYLPEMLKPKPMALRAQLWSLSAESAVPPLPVGGLVSITPPSNWPAGFAAQMGWVPAGEVLVRLDVAERVAGELGHLTRRAPALLPHDVASRLGLKSDALQPALQALGFRLLNAEPLPEDMFGPPAPVMVAARREDHGHRGRRPEGRGHGSEGRGAEGRGRPGERDSRGSGRRPDRQGGQRPASDAATAPAETPADGVAVEATPVEGGAEAPTTEARPDNRPPRQDRPQGGRPGGDRSQGERSDRSRGDRPRGDRPQGERPQGDRPQGDRSREGQGDRGNRSGGDRGGDRGGFRGPPRGDRRDDRRDNRELRPFSSSGPQRGAGPDPDSPFAALLKLKLGK